MIFILAAVLFSAVLVPNVLSTFYVVYLLTEMFIWSSPLQPQRALSRYARLLKDGCFIRADFDPLCCSTISLTSVWDTCFSFRRYLRRFLHRSPKLWGYLCTFVDRRISYRICTPSRSCRSSWRSRSMESSHRDSISSHPESLDSVPILVFGKHFLGRGRFDGIGG